MPSPAKKSPEHRPTREGKGRKEFWLDPDALRRAQTILGTATERETVEAALDMIAFRRELLDGLQVLSGLQIDPIREGDQTVRKYALDSNCYIDAIREPAARASLEAFTAREAP